jgi:hypothetical protein
MHALDRSATVTGTTENNGLQKMLTGAILARFKILPQHFPGDPEETP